MASADEAAAAKAIGMIQELTATPELNKTYLGKVQRITDFGMPRTTDVYGVIVSSA